MTAQWVKYNGSDAQIGEMDNSAHGWIVMFKDDHVSNIHYGNPNISVNMAEASKYLICQPHPRADMICQQARTGQPVWVRPNKPYKLSIADYEDHPTTKLMVDSAGVYLITTTPDWDIPNAEYSFTPFEDQSMRGISNERLIDIGDQMDSCRCIEGSLKKWLLDECRELQELPEAPL